MTTKINRLIGTAQADQINGSWADDYLDGGAGADTLVGGAGNDIYVVDNIGDVVREILDFRVNNDTAIKLVSTNVSGVSGNGQSGGQMIAISGDGNLVGFYTRATNLLASDVNGTNADIGIKNFADMTLTNAHTNSTNVQPALGSGGGPEGGYNQLRMTPDGRYVIFASSSVALLPGVDDTTDTDIFVKDLLTGTVTIESQPSGGKSDYHSASPDISSDARYVVFTSMDNLVAKPDANGASDTDVYWRDRQTGELRLVSGKSDGTVQGQAGGNSADSDNATVSDNGEWVLFQSTATNLDPLINDTNNSSDLFLKNMVTGKIENLTAKGWNGSASNGSSYDAAITPDGRYAVFYSGAGNLIGPSSFALPGIYRMDLSTRALERVDTLATGVVIGYGQRPQITPDGRYVVFENTSEVLAPVAGGSTAITKIFVKDMATGAVETVSRTETGGALTNFSAYAPQISDDGRFIVFNTQANLVAGDTGTTSDVYRVPNPLYSPNDEVIASVSYSLPPGVEKLTLTGTTGLSGTGNTLANTLVGSKGNDTLDGGSGTDIATFTGKASDYRITFDPSTSTYSVTDTVSSRDGTDKLISIEAFQFSDGTKQLATTDALLVGRLSQAIFGKAQSSTTFTDSLSKAGPTGNVLDWAKAQASAVSSLSDAAFATLVLKNLSITNTSLFATPTFGTPQQAYDALHGAMTGYLGLVGNASRGIVAAQLAGIIAGFEGETIYGVYGGAAKAFNQQVGANIAHSINTGNTSDIIAVPVLATGSTTASGGDFSFMLALGNYGYQISGFGAGDKIVGPAGVAATLSNPSATDGAASLQYTSNGQTVSITLTGLTTAQDGALTGIGAFNTLFGAGALG